MREFRPIPDPSGSLQPPNRRPPTAVGAETPEPELPPRPRPAPRRRPQKHPRLEAVLDVVLGIPLEIVKIARRRIRKLRR